MKNIPFHWPPSSPDCNPLNYMQGVVEAEVNKIPHNTINPVKIAVGELMSHEHHHQGL